jgi:hypothetical protein
MTVHRQFSGLTTISRVGLKRAWQLFTGVLHKAVSSATKFAARDPSSCGHARSYNDGFPQVLDAPATKSDTGAHYNHIGVFENE